MRHVPDEWLAYEPLGRIMTREHPFLGEGYLYRGIGQAVKKDYAGAEEAFGQGIKAEPANADLEFAAGWAILRQERAGTVFQRNTETVKEALSHFERALEINPTHQLSLPAAGYASLAMNDKLHLGKAAEYFERLRQRGDPTGRIGGLLEEIHRQLEQP